MTTAFPQIFDESIMRRGTIILLFGLLSFIGLVTNTQTATAAEKVIILPFQVNAPDDSAYLQTQIASVLTQQITKDGAEIVSIDKVETKSNIARSASDFQTFRDLAVTKGADFIVWGSFTLLDEDFSLDTYVLNANNKAQPEQLFVQEHGLENLLRATQRLGDRISRLITPRDLIAEIMVKGNKRIESDAILRVVSSQKGGTYNPGQISKDIREIFKLGYFDDIRVDTESTKGGKIVTFHITEKPTIRHINISGNSYLDEDDIRETLTLSTGSILNLFKVRNNIDQIKQAYTDKNYYNAEIDYKVKPVGNNQADLEFIIQEGSKLYVTDVTFEGNLAFTPEKLRKTIKTKKKGFFFFLTESGDLKQEVLDQDVILISDLYQNHGFVKARVSDPQIDIMEKEIHIAFKIEEGPQYRIKTVDITGDLLLPKQELLQKLAIKTDALMNREVIRSDITVLSDIYANQGFAHAEIIPHYAESSDDNTVDLTFKIKKNELVYFENITISGNTRTRDKVIRRELEVVEKEQYNNQGLKRSFRNLYRLDFFDNIQFNTPTGSDDDKMNLDIEVVEKGTGSFNFGGGYSAEEYGFLFLSVSERNFLGRAQEVELSGTFGSSTTRYQFSFTEPWLFDIPLYSKVNVYDQEKSYSDQYYDMHSNGAGLKLGYRIFKDTYFYTGYSFDTTTKTIDYDENGNYYDETPDSIRKLEGNFITSSVDFSLVYDTRNHRFMATEGMKQNISFEYAGVGGDIGYNKLIGQSQFYFPIYKKLVGFVHGKVGYVYSNDDNKVLPDYSKFYLGGVTSLRGFKYHGVYSTELDENNEEQKVGGNTMVQFNAELIFPLVSSSGVNGVVFYDTGNVYGGDINLNDLRSTAGIGIKWLSPLAPIQIVYGWVLDQKDGEEPGRLEFSFGAAF